PAPVPSSPDLLQDLTPFAAPTPRFLAVVALGGARTADRHDPRAIAELDALARTVADLTANNSGALIVITSRGATTIDDEGSDFYGTGSSRPVPLILVGRNVGPAIVSGQPASPAGFLEPYRV